MGYVKEELAGLGQTVSGVVIGFEDAVKIHRALSVAPKDVLGTSTIVPVLNHCEFHKLWSVRNRMVCHFVNVFMLQEYGTLFFCEGMSFDS